MINLQKAGEHVKDDRYFHLPEFIGEKVELPVLFDLGKVHVFRWEALGWEGWEIGLKLQLTRFMVLEAVVGVVMLMIFIPLARKIASGKPPRGRFWNLFEAMLLFLRDGLTRPAIGGKEADRFLPFIWTLFFFILFCNLLGMIPWAGSPTGALAVTGALALVAFCTVIGSGMAKFGLVGFWTGMAPHMDMPLALAILLKPMILLIEVMGLCIRHSILAVRLLANMFAGHLVLAVIIGFIAVSEIRGNVFLWLGVTAASMLGAVALSLLELFVAFLQAYIFTFLSAVFIGMAVHQH